MIVAVSAFHHQQRTYFRSQCSALRDFCERSNLRPLVMMGSRSIFNIYCDGNKSAAMHGRPVNDDEPAYPPQYTP